MAENKQDAHQIEKRGSSPAVHSNWMAQFWQATVEHVCGIRRPWDAVYLCPLIRFTFVHSLSFPSSTAAVTQLHY